MQKLNNTQIEIMVKEFNRGRSTKGQMRTRLVNLKKDPDLFEYKFGRANVWIHKTGTIAVSAPNSFNVIENLSELDSIV
ncbi:hypothetical protein LA020_002897 [Vibrio alginolyticus]|nr:hypothetical protein [Vibrio alginolyticus]